MFYLCYVMLYSVDDSDDGALDRFKTKVQIKSNGQLMWMAPKIVSSSCKFDVTYFPFDRQVNFIDKFTISDKEIAQVCRSDSF